ncbi:potassium channel family protein [Leptolyngbya sp. PCC 6406]|uniref:potassium channel family protein n=1 Tax=Leptolyngbya sp. PCC 6406 TaxID=1173264 RepID=UPI0002ABD0B6|nr:potassium channel protein [Leptolyngbya sp. PCC 6406]
MNDRRNSVPFSSPPDHFLVCGLGSLGQHCVVNLKIFGVQVSAVELSPPLRWEVATLPQDLETLVVGDCRQAAVLEQAGVRHCRAALFVTTDEQVNLEAALTARVLNPTVRLVVRSDKQNLNELLTEQLTNFVAFEPTQLAAPAFALAALGEELLGVFNLGSHAFRIRKQIIDPQHPWCGHRQVHEVDTPKRRVLRHIRADVVTRYPDAQVPLLDNPQSASAQFYTWLPNSPINAGDVLVTVEVEEEGNTSRRLRPRQQMNLRRQGQRLRRGLVQFWQASYKQQIRRVAFLCGMTVVLLCVLGVILMRVTELTPTVADAFYATVVLLLGGYGDLFSDLAPTDPIPWWLRLFSLGLTLMGTAFIGVLYALLTEKLLTLKFEFLARRPPIPERDHVAVIWLGRVGRRVVELLQELQQPVVGITSQTLKPETLPNMPLITGPIGEGLKNANLAQAKSVVAVSDNEMQNLELGLMAYRVNPRCRLIIRTYDQVFTDKVAQLFPNAQVVCASALSAEAFAGAAFGEQVVSLFRLYHQTVMVTQYRVAAEDTLHGLLLADVAYGYGVVPILHQRGASDPGSVVAVPRIMPSDDIRLEVGDRLVVLATIRGLQRIEQHHLALRQWRVEILQAVAYDAQFEGAAEIARVAGCDIGAARTLMTHLPAVLPQPLHRHQALRLVRLLLRSRVKARVLSPQDSPRPSRN